MTCPAPRRRANRARLAKVRSQPVGLRRAPRRTSCAAGVVLRSAAARGTQRRASGARWQPHRAVPQPCSSVACATATAPLTAAETAASPAADATRARRHRDAAPRDAMRRAYLRQRCQLPGSRRRAAAGNKQTPLKPKKPGPVPRLYIAPADKHSPCGVGRACVRIGRTRCNPRTRSDSTSARCSA